MRLQFPAVRIVVLVALLLAPTLGGAQTSAGDPVLADNGRVKLYRSEYEAELLKLPAALRPGFANDRKRIADVIQRLIVEKTLALQARDQKLDQEPVNQTRLRLEHERLLAALRIEAVEAAAGREFDARQSQNEARAHELYLADRKKFETPEQVEASHILFDLRRHPGDEGRKLAEDARAKLVAGADFSALARRLSEDPSVAQNGGNIGYFSRGEMDPAFTDAAFALKHPGDISEPVLSTFGWHIIRLDARKPPGIKPFEAVKDQILADMREKYVAQRRQELLDSITRDPAMKVDQAAVDGLYVRPDPEAALRALQPGKPPAGLPVGAPTQPSK